MVGRRSKVKQNLHGTDSRQHAHPFSTGKFSGKVFREKVDLNDHRTDVQNPTIIITFPPFVFYDGE
jgi:hypothetical protein